MVAGPETSLLTTKEGARIRNIGKIKIFIEGNLAKLR
jgi:hypothetical protein